MKRRPKVGLNILAEDSFRVAAAPLFAGGLVDVLECNVDEAWGYAHDQRRMPRWYGQLLDLYADSDSLYGHCVWFSFLSAKLEARQQKWLRLLERACRRRRHRHVSEHFGFMTADPFVEGTLLPVPRSEAALRVGRDRLGRLSDAARAPVGLENIALALGPDDALEQGQFLRELLVPLGGFLLLDLHNVFTQATNLGLSPKRLLRTFPLECVREIHVSGGALLMPDAGSADRPLRLDTHDGNVPPEVLDLLRDALSRCPNVEAVIFERRGGTLEAESEVMAYRSDFARVRAVVRGEA